MSEQTYSSIFHNAFTGKRAVIIGAAQGIGATIATAFAGSGADVLIVDLSERVHEVAAQIRAAGGNAESLTANVTDDDDVAGIFRRAEAKWGAVDIVVNNAGIITIKRLEETTTDEFRRVIDVNTTGQFIAAREALPLLRAAGGGVILNAASGQARQGFIYTPSYAASKFGVVGLSQSLAKELARDNIRVNAYCPGIVETDMWDYNDREWGRLIGGFEPGEYIKKSIASIPLGRAATAADVANALLFLASDAGNYITGQALNVDGGMFMN